MRRTREIELIKSKGASVAEELEALNARARRKRSGPELIRRSMEAQIEAKARRRRRHEEEAAQQGIAAAKRV